MTYEAVSGGAEATVRADRAVAGSPFRWWIALLAAVLFSPPLPLSFTATRSVLSPAIFVALIYLPWRLLRLRGRITSAHTLYGAVTMGTAAYVALHATYYLIGEGNVLVFLMEAQWTAYFAAFACVVFDLRKLPDGRRLIARTLLLAIFVQALLGLVSSFTGPLFDTGAWHEDRFGIGVFRATGTLGSPNALGGVVAIGALLALFERREVLPLPRLVMLPPMLLALFWSQSKSAWLSFIVAATLVVAVRFLLAAGAWNFLAALALAGCMVGALSSAEVWGELSKDYAGRATFGEQTLEHYVKSSPLREAFGVGFRQTARIDPDTRAWLTAHNSYLSLLAEIGLAGVLLLASLWALSVREIAHARDWSMLAVLACILLHSYSEAFLYGNVYVLLMLAVPAAASMSRAARHRAGPQLALDRA